MSISTFEDFEAGGKVYDEKGMHRIPKEVRNLLGIEEGDKVEYRINENNEVVISRE